jgi:hypothetical protein
MLTHLVQRPSKNRGRNQWLSRLAILRWWHNFPPPPGTPAPPGTGGGASSMGPGWESAKNQLRGLASNSK